ncbi:MAG: hypothetical protein EOM80_01595 [Erysipelotrichia bacterium]|nr:hypothetical protein [Erysipelotrichia bacterium]
MLHKKMTLNEAVNKLRLHYFAISLAVQTIWLLTLCNFFAGLFFLILRQLQIAEVNFVGFAFACVPVCALLASIRVMRHMISHAQGLAIIDSCNHTGGLLMATYETGDHSWSDRLPESFIIPRLRMRAKLFKRLPPFFLSLIFLLLCIHLPLYLGFTAIDPRINLQEITKNTQIQIETLEETALMKKEEAVELKQALEHIIANSDRNNPAKTFEALDQLQAKLKKESSENARSMIAELAKLGKLDALTDDLTKKAAADNPVESSEAAAALKNSLKNSDLEDALSDASRQYLDKAMQQSLVDKQISARELSKLEKELKEYIQKQADKKRLIAEKLAKARLIDKKTFEQLKKEGRIKPVSRSDIEQNPDIDLIIAPEEFGNSAKTGGAADDGNAHGAATTGEKQGGGFSSGGVSRGGESAPLNFNRKSSEHNIEFRNEQLPPADSRSLENAVTVGIGVSAPEVDTEDSSAKTPAAESFKQSSRNVGESVIILPRHRSAVKKYFERTTP